MLRTPGTEALNPATRIDNMKLLCVDFASFVWVRFFSIVKLANSFQDFFLFVNVPMGVAPGRVEPVKNGTDVVASESCVRAGTDGLLSQHIVSRQLARQTPGRLAGVKLMPVTAHTTIDVIPCHKSTKGCLAYASRA